MKEARAVLEVYIRHNKGDKDSCHGCEAAVSYGAARELRGHVDACEREGYDIVNRKAVACGHGYYCPDAPTRPTAKELEELGR